jgi:hypothetical protein
MRYFLKIFKWISLGIFLALVLLFGISVLLQDKIVSVFITSINKNISTKIEAGTGSFSLINKFPKASVRLQDVFIHSSPKFNRTQFKRGNTDTLLFAKSVVLEFKITDLINGRYNIESVNINNGFLNLFSDSSGGVNYEISFGNSSSSDKEFVISLDRINISDLIASYTNVATSLNIKGLIKNSRFKSRIAGNIIDLTANSSLQLYCLEIFPLFLKTGTSASFDLNLHKSDSGFFFRKGIFKIDDFIFGVTGMISDENILNLKITGRNIDVSRIKKYLSAKYQKTFTEYDPAGILRIDCGLTGLVDRKNNPEIRLNFSLENGRVFYKKSDIKLEKISFSGNFFNGRYRNSQTSTLILNKVKTTLGSSNYSASLKVENFSKPKINLALSGEIIPAELVAFFNIKDISWAKGSVMLDLKLSGTLPVKDKYIISDLMKLRPQAVLNFKSLGLGLTEYSIDLKEINGKVSLAKNIRADSLSFYYKEQCFKIDGDFTNLTAWLAGQNVNVKAVADLAIDNFNPSAFIADTSSVTRKQNSFKLPKSIELDINLNISNLTYKKISASSIRGKLFYKPGLLSFKSLNIASLDGNISGDCFLARRERESFLSHGNFTFNKIDINKAFYSFNNFGQDFIKAENLAGAVSGKLTVLMPLDSKLNPIVNAITAEGKYTISDGSLINFEPVKSLSDFIELSELENISFSRLENDFYIKNNYIAVPQMDIRSSAADFIVSGKHGFENDYQYHVKTHLSVLLSKKVKKGKKYSSEFGAVEDDGLGRSSVYLKITGKGENFKVGYDLKAAGGKLGQNFKTEKENLKSILNKEYGWYKKDSTIKQDNSPKPRFRIEWEENDSTEIRNDTTGINQDRGINSIFKKKKGQEP